MTRIPPAWADLPFFTDDWPRIRAALEAETRSVLPPSPLRFAALEMTAPEAVRVVILGQDPYPQTGKADGLAFSIPDGFGPRRRDSLSAILAEIGADTGTPRTRTDLSDLARQGVLLLNTALSVPEGMAGGHARLGWGGLVDQVIARVAQRPAAFLLWGGAAKGLSRRIAHPDRHLVLAAGHPSPLNTRGGFRGTRPFSRVNAWLIARGEAPINWA